MAFGLQPHEVALASLTDAELIRHLWIEIREFTSDDHRDDLYFTATEVLERFAPEPEWAVEQEDRRHSTSPEHLEDELASAREYRERRRRAREVLAAFNEEDMA